MVVMAILVLLAVAVIPSTAGLYGGTRTKGAADQIRAELAAARAWSMEEGVPVRVAVSSDGRKIRRAPESEFGLPAASSTSSAGARRTEITLDKVCAEVLADAEGGGTPSDDGWTTIAIFMPDGTCRVPDRRSNPTYTVALKEDGRNVAGIQVTVRALTGRAQTVVVSDSGKTGGQQ
jgi:Tfp pilus assembly protein FimT